MAEEHTDDKAEPTLPEEVHQDAPSEAAKSTEPLVAADEMTSDELIAALEVARGESATARDQALRAQAEVENVKRRAQRDVEHAHKFALEKFAGELLPVIDSLEKSVEAVDSDADVGAIAEGLSLSLKLAVAAMEKSGMVQLDPTGEPFDPEFHEAMSMLESAEAEPGSVLQVLQRGYTLNGRLVRAAMVLVAKEPAGDDA